MRRSQVINAVGGIAHQRRAGDHRGHQVHPRRLAGARRDADALPADAGDQPALLERRRAAGARHRLAACCPARCTRSCWSPRCTSRRCGRWPSPGPPGPTTHRADGQRRRRRDPRAAGRLGALRPPGAADRAGVAVPGDHPAGRRLRQGHPPGQPAGARRGLRAAVRRRPLVGERPAQPERAAAARPAAVPARRDDHHGAVAAGELGRPGRRRRRTRRPGSGRPAARAHRRRGRATPYG